MIESFRLFVRTYVYWVGLILGVAIFPGYLLYTVGAAPVEASLWLAPLAGLPLLALDPPATWPTPRWQSLVIRAAGAAFAIIMLFEYGAFSRDYYGTRRWSEVALSLGLGWIAYVAVAAHIAARSNTAVPKFQRAWCVYITWTGIYLGIFYIPAVGLAAAGTLLMLLPLYGTFLTGLVLIAVDPPHGWPQPRAVSALSRIVSSGAAALLFAAAGTFYRDTTTGKFDIVDWQENVAFSMGAWAVYVVAAGVAYVLRDPSHGSDDNLSR